MQEKIRLANKLVSKLKTAYGLGGLDAIKDILSNCSEDDNVWVAEWACKDNHLDIIKHLVENGFEIHGDANSAISEASSYGQLEIVKYLIDNGADVTCSLECASSYGQSNIVEFLLDNYKSRIDRYDKSLRTATRSNHLEVIKLLLNNGGDAVACLRYATTDGYIEIVKYIEGLGIDVANDSLAVKYASNYGYFDIVKYIHNDLKTVSDYSKVYALNFASSYGHIDIVKYLVDECDCAISRNNFKCVISSAENGHIEIVDYLINKGIDLNIFDDYLLGVIVKNGHIGMLDYLMNKIKIDPIELLSAFKVALEKDDVELAKKINNYGFNFRFMDEIDVSYGISKGCINVLKYMISNGLQPHSKFLESACDFGKLELVKFLVNIGISANTRRDTPIIIASGHGYIEIVKFLHSNGANLESAIMFASSDIEKELILYKESLREKSIIEKDLKQNNTLNKKALVKKNVKL